jgi:hypothetical protein
VGGRRKGVGVMLGTESVAGMVGYGKGLIGDEGFTNKIPTITTTVMVAKMKSTDKKSQNENFIVDFFYLSVYPSLNPRQVLSALRW